MERAVVVVGHRLPPSGFGARTLDVREPPTAIAAALVGQHQTGGAEEPEAGLAAGWEIVASTPRHCERLGSHVVGLVGRRAPPPGEAPHVVELGSEERPERSLIHRLRRSRPCAPSVPPVRHRRDLFGLLYRQPKVGALAVALPRVNLRLRADRARTIAPATQRSSRVRGGGANEPGAGASAPQSAELTRLGSTRARSGRFCSPGAPCSQVVKQSAATSGRW